LVVSARALRATDRGRGETQRAESGGLAVETSGAELGIFERDDVAVATHDGRYPVVADMFVADLGVVEVGAAHFDEVSGFQRLPLEAPVAVVDR
jgi:hypothetical protein